MGVRPHSRPALLGVRSALLRVMRRMSRPVSRILFPPKREATIHLGRPLLDASCDLPADMGRAARQRRPAAPPKRNGDPLGLAPGGVYLAAPVTRGAGELLPHRFTLTRTSAVSVSEQARARSGKGRWRFNFCGTVPHVTVGGCWPPPLLYGVRTFLDTSTSRRSVPRPPGRLIRTPILRPPRRVRRRPA